MLPKATQLAGGGARIQTKFISHSGLYVSMISAFSYTIPTTRSRQLHDSLRLMQ